MPDPIADQSLLCPACGFDLRAATTNRCSECGLEVDRAALMVSGIPWAHRRRLGRFPAYFKTLWGFTIDRKSFCHEAAKPQELADARAFRRINAWIVAAAFLAAFATVAYLEEGLGFLAAQVPDPLAIMGLSSGPPQMDPHWFDLVVPWSAAATLPPVLPICLTFAAFWVTGAQRFVFRVASSSPLQRQRALCLSHYTSSPLVYLLPVSLLIIIAALISRKFDEDQLKFLRGIILTLTISGTAIFFIVLLSTLLHTARWLMRTRHCGIATAVLALLELLFLWVLGGVVLLGLLPWCVGFIWIVIDSLR